MSFDIESMFAEAANAAEDTGEKDPSKIGKDTDKKVEVKQEPKPELKKEPKPELKAEPKPEVREEPKPEVKARPKPELKTEPKVAIGESGLSVEYIEKVLKLNEVMNTYNEAEKKFVFAYFEGDEEKVSQVIYKALTANRGELEALNKIVTARSHTAAERAFYLMDLPVNDIRVIYDQVDRLTGELDESIDISESNKIKVCRVLEKTISSMRDDVFLYIKKLQDFTDKAI